jgi:hypothetical protein
MEIKKDLKVIKESITIVTGDKDVNELVTEYIQKDYDCFGRAYLEGHPECRQCVIISEFKDFQTGEFRRDPLWVVCFETCKFLSEKEQRQTEEEPEIANTKEVESDMQLEERNLEAEGVSAVGVSAELITDESQDLSNGDPGASDDLISKKPRKRLSANPGHSKTFYRTCSKCGQRKSLYESTYNNAMKRYGSVEEMNKRYLCKKCRKEQ